MEYPIGISLAETPYLIALALFEQDGQRAMPLAGRSQKSAVPEGEVPEVLGHSLALELLLRVWQRSDDGPLRRIAGSGSLLLVEVPMERLSEDLPAVKAAWLNSGDTGRLMAGLREMSLRGWTLTVSKFEPVTLMPW